MTRARESSLTRGGGRGLCPFAEDMPSDAGLIRIGDSTPAPLLTLIVGPSDEGREAGKTSKEFSGRHVLPCVIHIATRTDGGYV